MRWESRYEMESIEKLRKYIGDRAEYKTTVWEEGHAIADEIEREIEQKYMPLPVDENDQTIRIGDELDGYNQKAVKVEAVSYGSVVVRSNVKGGYGYHDEAYPLLLWSAASTAHVKPDPYKELLEEFGNEVARRCYQAGLDMPELVDEFTPRFKELGKA